MEKQSDSRKVVIVGAVDVGAAAGDTPVGAGSAYKKCRNEKGPG